MNNLLANFDLIESTWIDFFNSFETIIVGYSGGLDSTVLLHAINTIPSLKPKILAVHVNHGISEETSKWQAHCQNFCAHYGIPFNSKQICLKGTTNIEARARKKRYDIFSSYMNKNTCLVLAHHQNDQAETLMLQLFRGTGIDGLSAMIPKRSFQEGILARPLLKYKRIQLENYANSLSISYIHDKSNDETLYNRNFLRHEIIPLLEKRWPALINNLARTAKYCQSIKQHLDQITIENYQSQNLSGSTLDIKHFETFDNFQISNLLCIWLKNNQLQIPSTKFIRQCIDELIFAKTDKNPLLRCGNKFIRRYHDKLYLVKSKTNKSAEALSWSTFPEPLIIPERGVELIYQNHDNSASIKLNQVTVCFRKGGETLRLKGQGKKVKKLFQEWNIPPWERENIPLIFEQNTLIAIANYAVSDILDPYGKCQFIAQYKDI